jgi:Beta/Gamma crystallin
MKRGHLTVGLGALLILVAAASSREAVSQGWRRDQVCVYEHADYGGWEQCFGAGESLRDLGPRRNRISSVRIMGRAEVTLFEYPDFNGKQVAITNDISDLSQWRGWNDQADSLRVHGGGVEGRPGFGRRGEDRVCLYEHVGYQGRSQCFDSCEDVQDMRLVGWNDVASSIRTFGRTRIVFYEHMGFGGERLLVDGDIPDLTRVGAHDGNWNDRISSLRMRGDGRDGRDDRDDRARRRF